MKYRDMDQQKDDFEKWLNQWDKVSEQFSKEYAEELAKAPKNGDSFGGSFFNSFASTEEPQQEIEDDFNWRDIYARAVELDYSKEDLLNEMVPAQDSEANPGEVKFGGRPPTKSNPIHYASVGNDQEGDDGHTRVSKNFSDGDELRELDDIKRRLQAMEDKFMANDVLQKKTESIQKELDSLRERAKKLSQQINTEPMNDVT
jgi:hypothetical protein